MASTLLSRSGIPIKKRKVVVVTFGGGARDQETFAPEGQVNITHLIRELIPQSSFFTQAVNRGILGHFVATASLATGVCETFNNFSAVPPENPTVFEYFRKDLKRPPFDAWVVAPSNGFHRIGESGNRRYRAGLGAGVILPKKLRSLLSRMRPEDLGFSNQSDAIMNRFQLRILTEGSATQIFSTTFVQWTAREALRRAQPITLLVWFAPRQRQKPMNELLSADPGHTELDPIESLVDGDMGPITTGSTNNAWPERINLASWRGSRITRKL
jgi:hypothetical protein